MLKPSVNLYWQHWHMTHRLKTNTFFFLHRSFCLYRERRIRVGCYFLLSITSIIFYFGQTFSFTLLIFLLFYLSPLFFLSIYFDAFRFFCFYLSFVPITIFKVLFGLIRNMYPSCFFSIWVLISSC